MLSKAASFGVLPPHRTAVEPLESRQLLSGTLAAPSGQTFEVMAKQSSSQAIGEFSTARPDAVASDFSATIHWGNGDSSNGIMAYNGTDGSGNILFSVAPDGGYTYSNVGPENATIDVTDNTNADTVEANVAVAADGLFSVRHRYEE